MNIIVCVKHVPDPTEIRVDAETGALQVRSAPTKISDYDKNAVEEAVRIKERYGGAITLLSVGPREATKTLKEALAMGGDKAVLISGDWVDHLDPISIARVLATAIRKLDSFDLILCGDVSEDGFNAQVGPSLGEWLGLPHVTMVSKLEFDGDRLVAERDLVSATEVVICPLPAVVTVNRSINTPRLPTVLQVMRVPLSKIVVWSLPPIGLEEADFSLEKLPLSLLSIRPIAAQRRNVLFQGEPGQVAQELCKRLSEEGVL